MQTGMVVITAAVFIGGCTGLSVNKLGGTMQSGIHCTVPEDEKNVSAFITDTLLRTGMTAGHTVRLISGYGSSDKYVTLYRTVRGDSLEYTLLFHFRDRYDYDLSDEQVELRCDTSTLRKSVCSDGASVVISQVTDQYSYVHCSRKEARDLAFSETLSGTLGPVSFEIPKACRTVWQQFFE
jgi:hypothetical protein